jgi:hypothetical protein
MTLDPKRYIRARLAVPEHKLPFRGRFFGDNVEDPGFEMVDTFPGRTIDAYLLRDGSIVPEPKVAAPTHED